MSVIGPRDWDVSRFCCVFTMSSIEFFFLDGTTFIFVLNVYPYLKVSNILYVFMQLRCSHISVKDTRQNIEVIFRRLCEPNSGGGSCV